MSKRKKKVKGQPNKVAPKANPIQLKSTLKNKVSVFYKNHKILLKSLVSLIAFSFPTYFLIRPSVQIDSFQLLNPKNPFSIIFVVKNNSNFSIENFDNMIFASVDAPGIHISRFRSYHNNLADPNFQSPIPKIEANNYSTLNKTGVDIELPATYASYVEIIIVYNYDYWGINFKDSVLFKANKTIGGSYEWNKYSFN